MQTVRYFLIGILTGMGILLHAQEKVNFDPSCFKVDVHQMTPMSYPARSLSYGYSLEICNDSASVYLPYMGRVYQPVMNDDGLHFKLPVEEYRVERTRKGATRVRFTVRKLPVFYRFVVTVHDNGRSDISLIPSNAQGISYWAELTDEE